MWNWNITAVLEKVGVIGINHTNVELKSTPPGDDGYFDYGINHTNVELKFLYSFEHLLTNIRINHTNVELKCY